MLTCASMSEPVHPCAFTCEDMCARIGKQLDGGGRNTDHDQMDSSSWETSLVSSTRRFPALMTDLLKKKYLSHHVVKGQQSSRDGVSFLGRLDLLPPGHQRPTFTLVRFDSQVQFPGPAVPWARSLSTSGCDSPISGKINLPGTGFILAH